MIKIKAVGWMLALGMLPVTTLSIMSVAQAQTAPSYALVSRLGSTEMSAQSRTRRPRVRIFREDDRGVYPSYYPGPNAVRDCSTTYVQEFRPSGTVIVPRINCFWRPG